MTSAKKFKCSWEGADLPPSLKSSHPRTTRFIYGVIDTHSNKFVYVGDSNDIRERASSHKYDIHNTRRGATELVKYGRKTINKRNLHLRFVLLEAIKVKEGEDARHPTKTSLLAERRHIEKWSGLGHPITNNPEKTPKSKRKNVITHD